MTASRMASAVRRPGRYSRIVYRLDRSTRVAIAERLSSPVISSPSQCPGSYGRPPLLAAGRSWSCGEGDRGAARNDDAACDAVGRYAVPWAAPGTGHRGPDGRPPGRWSPARRDARAGQGTPIEEPERSALDSTAA